MTGRITWLTMIVALLLAVLVLLNCCGGGRITEGLAEIQPLPDVVPVNPEIAPPAAVEISCGMALDLEETLKELAEYPAPEGIDPEMYLQLKEALSHQLIARQHSKDAASVPTTSSGYVGDLSLSNDYELEWTYVNTGDYDLNSEVSISDITPIGLFYGALIGDEDWEDARAADGDGNGEVNLADITPIGMNYGHKVTEYRAYASADHQDHPNNNGGENGAGALLVGTIAFDGSDASRVPGGIEFLYQVPSPTAHEYYWLLPSDGTDEGIASNLVGGDPDLLPVLSLTNPPGSGDGSEQYPYIVNDQTAYMFQLTDPVDGNVTHHIETEYTVFPTAAGTIDTSDATLEVRDGFIGNLIVQAWYQGKPNRSDTTVHCYLPANNEGFGITGVTPTEGGSGTITIFAATVTGGDPQTDEYAWDFGEGASPVTSEERNPECVLETVGNYNCSVTVTNSDASQVDTYDFTLTVTPTNDPPEIVSLSPRYSYNTETDAWELYVGSTIEQQVHCLASGTRPISYAWNFSEGATPNSFDWSPDHVAVTITPIDTQPADQTTFANALVNVENAHGEDYLYFDMIVEQPPRFFTGPGGLKYWGKPGAQKVFTIGLQSGSYPLHFLWDFGGGALPNTLPQDFIDGTEEPFPAILDETGIYDGTVTVSNVYDEIQGGFQLSVGIPIIQSVNPLSGDEYSAHTFTAVILGDDETSGLEPEYSWDFGGGATPNTSTDSEPQVILGANGAFDGSLTFTNKYGSVDFDFVITILNTPPQAPASLVAEGGPASISLYWEPSPSPDVEVYEVERKLDTEDASAWTKVNEVPAAATGYTEDVPGAEFYNYRIRARDQLGLVSIYSNTASAWPWPWPIPAPPTELTASSDQTIGHTNILLEWQPSVSQDILVYELERKLSIADSTAWFNFVDVSASTTQYVDSGLSEISYDYRIRARNLEDNVSEYSNSATQVPWYIPGPDPPLNVLASNEIPQYRAILITWDPPLDDSAIARYRIYDAGTDTSIYTTANKWTQAFTHLELTPDVTYSYYIKSVAAGDQEGDPSQTVSAVPSTGPAIEITEFTTDKTTHFADGGDSTAANLHVGTTTPPDSITWDDGGVGTFTPPTGTDVTWQPNAGTSPQVVEITCTVFKDGDDATPPNPLLMYLTSETIKTSWTDRQGNPDVSIGDPPYSGHYVDYSYVGMQYLEPLSQGGNITDGTGTFGEQIAGKVVMFNRWELWSGPDKVDLKAMDDYAEYFEPYDFLFIGNNKDERVPYNIYATRTWFEGNSVDYLHIYHGDITAVWDALGMDGYIPFKVMFDRDGYCRKIGGQGTGWDYLITELTGGPPY